MRKCIEFCVVICLCICLMTCNAFAITTADAKEPIVTSKTGSLTLNYVYGEIAFADLPVQLHHVATVSSDCTYTLTEEFRATGLKVNGITSSSEWNRVRSTLESYIASNKIAPTQQANTNEAGVVKFEGLTPGLYFVMPVRVMMGELRYSFASAIVAVPNLTEDGHWVYDVTITTKPSVDKPTDDEEHKVVKLWRDTGNVDKRPDSIMVDIICNGVVVETVVLSEENNWSYKWISVEKGDIWQVVEKDIPEGYTVVVEKHNNSFTIINTIPGTPTSPQTGDTSNIVLYIILMCVSGLVLVVLGVTAKGKAKK